MTRKLYNDIMYFINSVEVQDTGLELRRKQLLTQLKQKYGRPDERTED